LKNINRIYSDHVSSDMTKDECRTLCRKAWNEPHGFVVIDLDSQKDNGMYRVSLDTFYITN